MSEGWSGIAFGLGTIEFGRAWGFRSTGVPDDRGTQTFLEGAFEAGVRLFDTAPSYGHSERRLGEFLRRLTAEQRASVRVATKFGETWDFENDAPVVDHSYETLMRSLEKSLELLGRINVVQVHKSTPEVLRSEGVRRALEEARRAGAAGGASVKDLESARIACEDPLFTQMQIPFHKNSEAMLPTIEMARASGRMVFTNRPYDEGKLIHAGVSPEECIRFVKRQAFDGAILFGTSNLEHLRGNLAAFAAA